LLCGFSDTQHDIRGSAQTPERRANPADLGFRGAAAAEQRLYAKLVAVEDAAAGIKTFTFSWPEPPTRAGRPQPFAYQPGMYASFDFQARRRARWPPGMCGPGGGWRMGNAQSRVMY